MFQGSDLIYERAEYLEEDEIEGYERNAAKTFKHMTNHGQLQLIVEPEGQPAVKAYFIDSSGLKEPCLEAHIGNEHKLTDFETFMVASNAKIKVAARKIVDPKIVAMQAQATCADITDSEDVIEEPKKSQTKTMDIEVYANQVVDETPIAVEE